MTDLRFCPCGFSFNPTDPSDPMKWHHEVGIHQARIEAQNLERLEMIVDVEHERWLSDD
jgi:hypothetical protein